MQLNLTAAGGIQIVSTVPSIALTGSPYNAIAPAQAANNGSFPPADGNTGYYAQAVIYAQFGISPANFIGAATGVASASLGISGGRGNILSVAGATLSATITAAQLADIRAASGVYAIAYIGIAYNNGAGGTLWIPCDWGTNASTFQPVPPGVPGKPVMDLTGGSLTVSWTHAAQAGAPIAGYTLKWGAPGGPYPNSVDCPIAAYPIGQTPAYVYHFAPSAFPFSGESYEFVVQAYDNGADLRASSYFDPHTISYFPPALPPAAQYAASIKIPSSPIRRTGNF